MYFQILGGLPIRGATSVQNKKQLSDHYLTLLKAAQHESQMSGLCINTTQNLNVLLGKNGIGKKKCFSSPLIIFLHCKSLGKKCTHWTMNDLLLSEANSWTKSQNLANFYCHWNGWQLPNKQTTESRSCSQMDLRKFTMLINTVWV